MLLLHFPQALHTALHVAAPQQLAPKVRRVPTLGTASSGIVRRAPILSVSIQAVESIGRVRNVLRLGMRVIRIEEVQVKSFQAHQLAWRVIVRCLGMQSSLRSSGKVGEKEGEAPVGIGFRSALSINVSITPTISGYLQFQLNTLRVLADLLH